MIQKDLVSSKTENAQVETNSEAKSKGNSLKMLVKRLCNRI